MNHFEVLIVGSGPGGLAAAYHLTNQQKKVAVIEKDLWGGTCPNRGCEPKKVLYGAVEAQEKVQKLVDQGLSQQPKIQWEKLIAFKETFTSVVPKMQKKALENAGITVIEGSAKFKDAHTLLVEDKHYTGETIILATGQRPSSLKITGREWLETSTDFLQMKQLPQSIVFIGGGYITFELANIICNAGSEVHILHHNETPLQSFDQEYTVLLMEKLQSKGIKIHLNQSIIQIEKVKNLRVTTKTGLHIDTDKVICATGRIPNLETLGLEEIGVDYTHQGLIVNDFLQTTVPHIYGIGDCLAKQLPKLTPVSTFEGNYVAQYLTNQVTETIHYPCIPTIIFSSPKLAQVGISTKTAKENKNYYIQELDLSQWFTYKQLNESLIKIKIIKDTQTDQLRGATVIGDEADQLINLFTLLLDQRVSTEELQQMLFLYPTIASDFNYFI